MSMITENTVVIRSKDVEKLHEAFQQQIETYGLVDNPVEVFNNGNISIWVFDCNGQPLGVEENLDFLILETNYLDDEPYYTQCYDENKGYCVDTEQTAEELIRKMVTVNEFEEIRERIGYSTQTITFEEYLNEIQCRADDTQTLNVKNNEEFVL